MSDTASIQPLVTLTENAISQIKEMQAGETEATGKVLRVYVEKGGCSGMQYGLVFDEQRPDDSLADFEGVHVVVDPFSANYLRGSVVDYLDSLTGGGFKVFNPNTRQSCGCGKSFET
jgi:iron-sulfur cluster assembly protein